MFLLFLFIFFFFNIRTNKKRHTLSSSHRDRVKATNTRRIDVLDVI